MEKTIKVIDFGKKMPLQTNLGGRFIRFTDELITTEDENHENQIIEVIDRKKVLNTLEEPENTDQ